MNSPSHEWADPGQIAEEIREMSGEKFFSAWQDGRVVPPMAATLGFRLSAFDEGRVEITCDPEEFYYHPSGMVHGGLAATLLDTVTGCAIHTLLPAGVGYATLDLHVTSASDHDPERSSDLCRHSHVTRTQNGPRGDRGAWRESALGSGDIHLSDPRFPLTVAATKPNHSGLGCLKAFVP